MSGDSISLSWTEWAERQTPDNRQLRRVAERLDELDIEHEGSGRGSCPVHNDGRPSFAVAPGDKVPVVFSCSAGCTKAEDGKTDIRRILKTLDLSWKDVTGEAPTIKVSEPAQTWHYFDWKRKPSIDVHRFTDTSGEKTYRQFPAGRRSGSVKEIEDTPYHWPEIVAAFKAAPEDERPVLYVVEGEKCADALWKHGCLATTQRMGADQSWPALFTRFVKKCNPAKVRVVTDWDRPGFRRAASEVGPKLEAAGLAVEVVASVPRYLHADVVDHLAWGFDVDDLEPVSSPDFEAWRSVWERDPSGAEKAAERPERDAGEDVGGWMPIDPTPYLDGTYKRLRPNVGRREDGAKMLYPGKVHACYGASEGLKSWLAQYVCVQEVEAGRHVAYVDYEDSAQGVIGRLGQLGVRPENLRRFFHYIEDPSKITDAAKEAVRSILEHCSLVVIDAMTEALAVEGLSSNKDTEVADFNRRLPKWIAKLGPAVIVIDHTPHEETAKGRQTGSQHKKSGVDGASFYVKPAVVLAPGQVGRSYVEVDKDRHGAVRTTAVGSGRQQAFATFVVDATDPEAIHAELELPTIRAELSDYEKDAMLKAAISKVLEDADEELSVRRIRTTLRDSGVSFDNGRVTAALKGLLGAGNVNERPHRNGKLYRSIRPFSFATSEDESERAV